jgi:hypothetical protein
MTHGYKFMIQDPRKPEIDFPDGHNSIGKEDTSSTRSVYRQIVVNLTANYAYLHTHYQLNEEGMADKIVEIANKICSKI